MATNQATQVADATKLRDHVLKNVSSMTEEQRSEWSSRIWDTIPNMIDNTEAIELLDEAFNALSESMTPIQRQFEDEDEDEEEYEYDDDSCRHGKKFSEPCLSCDDEAAEDEELLQKEADYMEKAVEYNLWYQDGGHKEVASWNTHG